jgi:hypothetical protein
MDRVILKRCRNKPRDLIAFFPDAPANRGMILSYQRIGQHGEASLPFYAECRAVSWRTQEARALLRELKSLGYKPKRAQRLPAHWQAPC